jgi:hypothetical protein
MVFLKITKKTAKLSQVCLDVRGLYDGFAGHTQVGCRRKHSYFEENYGKTEIKPSSTSTRDWCCMF